MGASRSIFHAKYSMSTEYGCPERARIQRAATAATTTNALTVVDIALSASQVMFSWSRDATSFTACSVRGSGPSIAALRRARAYGDANAVAEGLMKKRIAEILVLATWLAIVVANQVQADGSAGRGTQSVFTMTPDGGVQTVTVNDRDPSQVEHVRALVRREVGAFKQGVYRGNAFLHGMAMPGLSQLRTCANDTIVNYESVPAGARVAYASTDPRIVMALHRWFSAQAQQLRMHASTKSGVAILQHFWPVRPCHAAISHVRGVLVSYGMGNGGGGFAIRLRDGSKRAFWAAPERLINGKPVYCTSPPQCPGGATDWPKTVTLGSTLVSVTYWPVWYNGRIDVASDRIDVVPVPLPAKRAITKP